MTTCISLAIAIALILVGLPLAAILPIIIALVDTAVNRWEARQLARIVTRQD